MVLLHTSDWHLGMSFRGRSSEEDQMHFIDQICSILIEKKVDALILAGDVFDKSIASSDAINLYDRIIPFSSSCYYTLFQFFVLQGIMMGQTDCHSAIDC